LLAALAVGGAARAQAPDLVLLNGKLVTYDGGPPAQALAVHAGRITAIGDSAAVRAHAGSSTRIIDLGGRTVIPGLIDSHIHAIRAGLTYTSEVHWIGVRTLAQALDRIRAAAEVAPKGSWLVVAGGWTERQFEEDRRPTQAEVADAAPDHHVYVQLFYSRVLLTPGGYEALGIARHPGLAAQLAIERDDAGQPTGWLTGNARATCSIACRPPHSRRRSRAPAPSFARSIRSG
jgi:predicted amidohydrolase YtcJ